MVTRLNCWVSEQSSTLLHHGVRLLAGGANVANRGIVRTASEIAKLLEMSHGREDRGIEWPSNATYREGVRDALLWFFGSYSPAELEHLCDDLAPDDELGCNERVDMAWNTAEQNLAAALRRAN
jgi:hypothetical protein